MLQGEMSFPVVARHEAAAPHCNECGDLMRETQRSAQSRMTFVWFECTRRGCSAVLLQRHFVDGSTVSRLREPV